MNTEVRKAQNAFIWYYLEKVRGDRTMNRDKRMDGGSTLNGSVTKEPKGSQLHLRTYVNTYSEELNEEIISHSPSLLAFISGERIIHWKSPLEHENYREYQDDFLKYYYEDQNSLHESNQLLRKYWPKNGPVWDGIGIVKGTKQKGLILVEAKAHIRETSSRIRATSEKSISLITQTISDTKKQFTSTESNTTVTPWLDEYYQLANRLAYLYLLNLKLHIPTWLIQVNFIEDEKHINTSKEQWILHYQKVFQTLGISHSAPLLSQLGILYLPVMPIKH